MAVSIRGKSSKTEAPKRSTRKTTAKPAAKATGTKRGTRMATTRKRSEPARKPTLSNRRSSVPQTDDKTMKKLLTDVQKAGALRKKAEEAHKASVQALYEAATNALNSGVPMAEVSKVSGISRQWLYKMGDFAKRGNGASAAKASTRKASTAKATPAKSTTKRTQSKTAGKTTRPRIRAAK
jgi:hypothetical protein